MRILRKVFACFIFSTLCGCPAPQPDDNMALPTPTPSARAENMIRCSSDVLYKEEWERCAESQKIGSKTPFCPAIDFPATIEECNRYTEEKGHLAQGVGVFNPPSKMVLGEAREVVLSIGPSQNSTATDSVHNAVPGDRSNHKELTTDIGHYMTASLEGAAFAISPSGPQERELTASRREIWRWRVTPTLEGKQPLTLTVSVDAQGAGGVRTRFDLATKPVEVFVDISERERAKRANEAIVTKLDEQQALLRALKGFLIALAAVIAAIGGVWFAFVKLLGRKKSKNGG